MQRNRICMLILVSSIGILAGPAAFSKPRGGYLAKFSHRVFSYSNATDRTVGQDHWSFFQQTIDFNSTFSFKGQGYGYLGNSKADLIKPVDRLDTTGQISEIWPGELYFQVAGGPAMFRIGYQQISWQEGFAFSFTNFINARDLRASFFDDADMVRRSAPSANLVISGDKLSFQAIYLPFSQADIRSPFSRWGARSGLTTTIASQTVEIEKPEAFKSSQEYGGRLTWAGEGFDVSIFGAHIRDRQGTYFFTPQSTFLNFKLGIEQDYISPFGATTSMTINDYTLRLEALVIGQKKFNRLVGASLSSIEAGETAFTVGLDSPSWEHISYSLQYSASLLDQEPTGLVRGKFENVSFGSVNYAFTQDEVLRLALVRLESDQTYFGRLSYKWPITRKAELEAAIEGAAGPNGSQGAAVQDLNRVFIQLSHVL